MDNLYTLNTPVFNQFSQQMSGTWFGTLLNASVKFAFVLILIIIAFFLARLIKTLVVKIFSKLSLDKKISDVFGANIELTDVMSTLGYYLVVLLFLPAILQSIGLSQMVIPIQNIINSIVGFIPQLVSALLVGGIFYIIAKVIADIASKFLTGIDLPSLLTKVGITGINIRSTQMTKVVRGIIFTLVLLIGSSQIFELLGLSEVGKLITQVIQGIGSIVLGGGIIGLGLYLGNIVEDFVSLSTSTSSRTLSMVCKYGIIVFALLIGLDKMGVPSNLINLLVMIVFGSLGLGLALAIGLGGKDVIGSEVKDLIHNLKKS